MGVFIAFFPPTAAMFKSPRQGPGSSCYLHFDSFRLRVFILRQIDVQRAVFELRADFAAVGALGQREAPEEVAVRLFAESCLLLFIEHAEGPLADGCDQTRAGPELALLPASAHTEEHGQIEVLDAEAR
jgi:hypothetical protein